MKKLQVFNSKNKRTHSQHSRSFYPLWSIMNLITLLVLTSSWRWVSVWSINSHCTSRSYNFHPETTRSTSAEAFHMPVTYHHSLVSIKYRKHDWRHSLQVVYTFYQGCLAETHRSMSGEFILFFVTQWTCFWSNLRNDIKSESDSEDVSSGRFSLRFQPWITVTVGKRSSDHLMHHCQRHSIAFLLLSWSLHAP